MRRLKARDVLLLSTLVPLVTIALGLHFKEAVRTGLAKPPLFVTAPAAGEDPHIRGVFVGRAEAVREAGLQIGDRLQRVGGRDVRGLGHIGIEALMLERGAAEGSVAIRYERAGRTHETVVALVGARVPGGLVPTILVSAFVAFVILVRAPSVELGRRTFLAIMLWLALVSDFGGGPALQTYAWKLLHPLLTMTAIPLVLCWARDFPHESRGRAGIARHWPWLFAPAHGLLRLSYLVGRPLPPELVSSVIAVVDGVSAVAFLTALTVSYRRSDPVERRQIKWVLYGFYLGIMPFALTTVLAALPSLMAWRALLWSISMILTISCSLGVLIAIVRYHVWDIDRLISATASYTLLGILVLAALLTIVPRVAEAASPMLGLDPATSQVVLAAMLAAVAVPANRRIGPWIDRVFFAERGALQQGIGQLLRDLATEPRPDLLLRRTGERLDELVRPEAIVLYTEAGPAYTASFVRGRAVPAAFAASGTLVAALHERREPLVAEAWSRARPVVSLDPLDRAALDTLGAAVAAPIHRADRLAAFLALGRKRSGDIYTHTDRTLLGLVCERAGIELARFDDAELARRQMQVYSELRRYVPDAIASKLERGEELTPAEREVSVLFVDIRDYTARSEPRGPEEIFSTINRYTAEVSRIVREHAGSVVEFNGDGMMAVFGAPEPLPAKEAAAVAAGLSVVSAVAALPHEEGESGPMAVGVGIATGPAFVGSIQSADRLIWTAIGNTTNLAARLQTLTRELGVGIVIDAPTHAAAGAAASAFELHPDQRIRGRSERVPLYSLHA